MAGESYVIEFKVVGSTEGIEKTVARAQQVLAKPFTVKVEADQDAFLRTISDLQARLQRIPSTKIGVDIDLNELLQKVSKIDEQIRKAGGKVPLDIDVDVITQKIQEVGR